jgi:predicted ATPase/DNA-binding response OmpR family regulator/class 3 adenylate cyclase
MKARVLVVAGNASLRAAIARMLQSAGYTVEVAATESDARAVIAREKTMAAIVAPAPTDRSLDIARELRPMVVKLVLVARRDDDRKRFRKLLPTADICPWPPRDAEELLRSLGQAAHIAKSGGRQKGAKVIRFEGGAVDLAAHAYIDTDGRELPLTRAELALLSGFLRSPGRVLSRDQLRQMIGGHGVEPYDRSIDMLVARLRRKIEPDRAHPRLILTVAGAGYKFAARPQSIGSLLERTDDSTYQEETGRFRRPAERRLLTVMACQIVGFGGLSSRHDPEDLREVIGVIRTECIRVLARFDGKLVHLLGASLLIYFGYSEAREDDVERAILAGLDLVHAIGGVGDRLGRELRLRVGIATGPVVIGDPDAGGTAEEHGAVGDALNLAMHLQSIANPGTVVIAEETHTLAGQFFNYQKLDPVVVDEGTAPVPAWRVTGVSKIAGRFDAFRRANMTEFVGRTEDLERLRRSWSQACAGSGRVVLLTGEAGIGKSRLAMAFEQDAVPQAVLRFFGSSHRVDASLFTLIDELERAAGFEPGDTSATRSSKLDALLARSDARSHEGAACIAHLMGLPVETGKVEQLTPQERKEKTFSALRARIEHMASRHPVLVLIEDAQWIDPTSLDFLGTLVERACGIRVMVLLTARPEFAPPWSGLAHVTGIALARLGRHDAESLIANVAGGKSLPRDVTGQILARADGVPLFLEEIAKTVLESGVLRPRGERYEVTSNMPPDAPKTLRASLLARVDRLGPGKELAQIGAAIGREFSHELLSIVAERPENDLAAALDRLVASGLVLRRGFPPYATYSFKHALVRDAAYDMLPRRRRQRLHASIADALEQRFPETSRTQPELLAHHCREAGYKRKAITYLSTAAECAHLRSGTSEALAHLTQAQELVSTLPDDHERSQLELNLALILGRVFTARRSYTAPETREAYRQARLRCEALANHALLPLIILGQWLGAWSAADHQSALNQAQDLYACGERTDASSVSAVAHMTLGMTLALLGDLVAARRHFEQALQIDRFALPPREPPLFPDTHGRISSVTYLHDCLLLLGFPDQAQRMANHAEAVANETSTSTLSQSYSRALAQNHTLRMHVFRRDIKRVAVVGSALLQLSQEQGYPYFIGTAMIYTGWALAHDGETARGIDLCHQGMVQLRAIGANCWLPRYHALLAECHQQAGDFERGSQAIASALQGLEITRERIWEAEIYRLKGDFLLRAGDLEQAQACFLNAISVARRQRARLLELRAATSLAPLFAQCGKSAKARQMLAKAYAWFTEGFDHADLQQARAVLETLPAG